MDTAPKSPMGELPFANASSIASTWLSAFAKSITSADVDATVSLFHPDSWMRDLLTFTWDIRTRHGRDEIKAYLSTTLQAAQICNVELDTRPGLQPENFSTPLDPTGVEAAFTFETPDALGRGSVRLLPPLTSREVWKAQCVMFMITDWKGHEESSADPSNYVGHNLSWEEVRQQRWDEIEKDPQVLIVGAGPSGLQTAARFRQMNIRALIVEQEARVGDNWRKRYPTLVMHTPRTHHCLLYSPFPHNWPIYTPRGKLASWLETYAESHDLLVWTSSQIEGRPEYDERTKKWNVTINKNGISLKLAPHHIVMATSFLGDPNVPQIPCFESFTGESLHSSGFHGGAPFKNKRVVVMGSGNSAADICQDLVVRGAAAVTMVQRSPTCAVSGKLGHLTFEKSYPEGVPTEVLDFKHSGVPLPLFRRVMKALQPWANHVDREMHDGLKQAGFRLSDGPDGSGQVPMVFDRGGGFLVDVGCASLIASGKVQVKQSVDIDHVTATGFALKDGSELPADTIIFATGWGPARDQFRRLFGDEVIDKTPEIWGLDKEGELRAGYKPSGQPGLWFAMGHFSIARTYSKQLALFIKAIEIGLFND